MPSTTPSLPASPYGTFSGSLFQYKTFPALVAFESAKLEESPNKCILIGGLSDGLIPTPYSKNLEAACHESGWSLVQPLISSSYTGFGNGSLQRDSDELATLMHYLIQHRGAERFALVGHSTGCQNSVHFLKHGPRELQERLKVIALQAPVSDREDAMLRPGYEENLRVAKSLQDTGKEDEMMPRSAFWAPITAARFLSLQDKGGEDDFFSSDFTDEELALRLRHVGQRGDQTGLKTLVAFSGADEYVPESIDTRELLERLKAAMTGQSSPEEGLRSSPDTVTTLYLDQGNHNLSQDDGDKEAFVASVKALLQESLN